MDPAESALEPLLPVLLLELADDFVLAELEGVELVPPWALETLPTEEVELVEAVELVAPGEPAEP